MIQRIQTLFLLIASALQIALLFMPIAEYAMPDKEIIVLSASGFKTDAVLSEKLLSTNINLIFVCLIALLLLISVFLFKYRILQMRICVFSILLLIGFQLFIIWFTWNSGQMIEAITYYKISIIFPIVSVILTYLAYRKINKDEKLVRSLNRIR